MIIQQPYEQSLGFSLINNLTSNDYSLFRFIVAYSKTSGVNRLLPYMKQFKEKNGVIEGVVGIDQYNTSYEALKSLQSMCDKLYVFHSENMMQTFHPKMYSFLNDESCWYAIGSNNMTAGGLFSNYELCCLNSCSKTDDDFFILENAYKNYTDTNSPCSVEATDDFIELLLENKYIKKEKELAKERISKYHRKVITSTSLTLFGNESFNAPILKPVSTSEDSAPTSNQSTQLDIADHNYLIRHIPKAGVRSKQVHFNIDILSNYFKLKPGDKIFLQQLSNIYSPNPIESRTVVFSNRNKNVKIEVDGAQILDTQYPDNLNKRPVLIVKKINPSLFEYMLLMDGNDGYNELNNHLNSLPHGRSLAYQILLEEQLLDIWGDCPLV